MSGRGNRAPAALLGLALLAAAAGESRAQRAAAPSANPRPPYSVGVRLSRGVVKLGEPVVYRGFITGGDPGRVRFALPDSGGAFTWSAARIYVRAPRGKVTEGDGGRGVTFTDLDTVFMEARLQAFTAGDLSVPGLEFELDDGTGPRTGRLPVAKLVVAPVLTAADSAADLRGLRGPLAAPWWERVPWRTVALVALGIAALVAAIVWWRRRRPAAAPAPVVARDPASQALAELEALRRLGLPARGRFGDHAFQLGRIVRRFLEAVAGTPLPGDTTPEFVTHLEAASLSAEDIERVGTLMRFWDRVKFARAEESVEEASRAEHSVESLVRRLSARQVAAEAPGAPVPGRAA